MNYEQKFQAMVSLIPFSGSAAIHMRKPGDWYFSLPGVEIKQGGCLLSAHGNGTTPEAAVNDLWQQYTTIPKEQYLVINSYGENRRAIKWNGFMWEDVHENIS
jgi:hypothetical protein